MELENSSIGAGSTFLVGDENNRGKNGHSVAFSPSPRRSVVSLSQNNTAEVSVSIINHLLSLQFDYSLHTPGSRSVPDVQLVGPPHSDSVLDCQTVSGWERERGRESQLT